MTDAQLIESAAAGDEGSFAELVEPHRRGLDRPLLPHARLRPGCRGCACRRRCCGHGGGCRRFGGGARCAAGCTRSPPTSACGRSSAGRRGGCPSTTGRPADPREPLGKPLVDRCGSSRTRRAGRPRGRTRRAGRPLRAAREHRARVHRALQLLPATAAGRADLVTCSASRAREVAEALDTTPGSVYSALQRAHATLEERSPDPSQQANGALGDEQLNGIVQRFVQAWARSDVDAIVGMLTGAATLAMPPIPSWYRGRDAIETVLRATVLDGVRSWRKLPTSANGQPGSRLRARRRGPCRSARRHVLTLDGADRRDHALRPADARAIRTARPVGA